MHYYQNTARCLRDLPGVTEPFRYNYDFTGQTIGQLRILERRGPSTWACRCACGRELRVRHCDLAWRRRVDCGCGWAPEPEKCVQPVVPSWAGKKYGELIGVAWWHAKRRGIGFTLSGDQMLVLFRKACRYCGAGPAARGSGVEASWIHRRDPGIGYHPDNCVAVCQVCARAKGDMPEREFKSWARKVRVSFLH